jgi:hypothetical protein
MFMSILIEKYKHFTFVLFGLALACQFLIIKYLTPLLAEPLKSLGGFGDILFFACTWTAAYIFIFRFPVFLYEAWLWKVLHPRLDFGGIWQCIITYDAVALPYGQFTSDRNLPGPCESFVEIEQKIFAMKMIEGFGRAGETWHSYSLECQNAGGDKLFMAYEVVRGTEVTISLGLPYHSLGLKDIEVEDRDRRGRPISMRGNFYHAALPDRPLFRGTTVFKRSTYAERKKFIKRRDDERAAQQREREQRQEVNTNGKHNEKITKP